MQIGELNGAAGACRGCCTQARHGGLAFLGDKGPSRWKGRHRQEAGTCGSKPESAEPFHAQGSGPATLRGAEIRDSVGPCHAHSWVSSPVSGTEIVK